MITLEKLLQYEEFEGDYDGYYLIKQKFGEGLVSNDEWHLIRSLIQDYKFVKNGIAADDFSNKIDVMIKDACDGQQTVNKLKEMA